MRASLLIAVPFIVINSPNHNHNNGPLFVHANNDDENFFANNNLNQTGDLECIDLADFFYEIVLSVTSFPEHGPCSDQEEAEIASLLQNTINTELKSLPGTIKTNNKVCSNAINQRRQLLTTLREGNGSFSLLGYDQTRETTTVMETAAPKSLLKKRSVKSIQQQRILLRTGRRSFIYVGGGRCRYCFYDDYDQRFLQQLPTSASAAKHHRRHQRFKKKDVHRDLLLLYAYKTGSYPKVSDISFCKKYMSYSFFLDKDPTLENFVEWRNMKETSYFDRMRNLNVAALKGPYKAGETFGFEMDMIKFMHWRNKKTEENRKKNNYDVVHFFNHPVKEGKIKFLLTSFDLPENFTTEMLADDAICIFINGIKIDFNLLIKEPGVKIMRRDGKEIRTGSSFAGIKWKITSVDKRNRDFALGPQPEREYVFEITAPLIVLAHKNVLDVDFMIKPTAMAKQYIFRYFSLHLQAGLCEITGLENSPFEDFQSVVESRLFHKLGKDLAQEFQGKQGHCLYDKIPVVNVHLVEKKNWRETNPHCE